ncbi:uncharacterized protein TNCV_651621 [Trichonephila clavipes]|nr:uncharacterized protein TNCV_651621 [Trichonephila clavipes]
MKRKENFQWLPKELHQLKYETISVPQGSVRLVKKTHERKSSTCYLLITKGVTSSSPVPLKTRRERERNEKVSNHGSIPITIDCNVVAFIVFEEGFHQPIKRTKQVPSGAPHSKKPKRILVSLELLQPCSKKEDPNSQTKGLGR